MEILVQHDQSDDCDMYNCMDSDETAYGRATIYHNQKDIVILDNLSVCRLNRNNGRGTKMQVFRENLGRKKGATKAMLWVESGTWQQSWYERRGYVYDSENKEQCNSVWMSKQLKD